MTGTRIGILLLLTALGCATCSPSEGGDTPVTVSPSPNITLPPAPTFAQYCARCHGPQGAFYAIPYHNSGPQLRQVIENMMRGPASLDPTSDDVDAMLQYHLSLRKDIP